MRLKLFLWGKLWRPNFLQNFAELGNSYKIVRKHFILLSHSFDQLFALNSFSVSGDFSGTSIFDEVLTYSFLHRKTSKALTSTLGWTSGTQGTTEDRSLVNFSLYALTKERHLRRNSSDPPSDRKVPTTEFILSTHATNFFPGDLRRSPPLSSFYCLSLKHLASDSSLQTPSLLLQLVCDA